MVYYCVSRAHINKIYIYIHIFLRKIPGRLGLDSGGHANRRKTEYLTREFRTLCLTLFFSSFGQSRLHFHGSTNDDFPYSFLTFWKFEQACHLRTLYEDFLSLLNAFLRNLVGFFFLLIINNIFGTVYLI